MGEFITPDVLPEDTFCRVLLIPNDPKWIGAVSGALLPMIYPSEWVSFGGLSPEDTAARCEVMLQEFWASNGCGDEMKCCDDQVRIKRINPETGRPQISVDGGSTWQSDPSDTQNNIQLLPPIVTSGGGSTKCDAATNASVHINELIDATGDNLNTASDVFALAVGIAEAILALFLIIISAGALTAPVTAVATAIWAAATSLFNLGIDGYNAYWTSDKRDAILCQLFCTIGANGQWTEEQYQNFRAGVKDQLPASPAFDIVMTSINVGGARGLSQMASYGIAADADCSDCGCGECIDQWAWPTSTFGANPDVVKSVDDNWITAPALQLGDYYYWGFKGSACCAMQVTVTSGDNPNAFKGLIPCPEPESWTFFDESSPPWTAAGLTLNGNAFAVLMRSTTPFTARVEFI